MAESVFGSSARFCGLPWIRLYLAFLGEKTLVRGDSGVDMGQSR